MIAPPKGFSMRLRNYLVAFALCLASCAAFGQGAAVTANLTAQASTCTPALPGSACLILPIGASTNTVVATLGGTFSGTLQFEASGDGASTWVSVAATPSSGGSSVTSATGTGSWQIQAGGYSYLRIRCSTYASGTVIATLNPSKAVTTSASSGSGSGTVTSVAATGANGIGVTGSPITASGTLAFSLGAITPTSTNGVSAATMAFLDATSSVQTQLNAKAPLASPALTGTPTGPLGNITQTIASGSSAMGTSAVGSGTCATVVTATATGTATTDAIIVSPNADPTGVTGYAVSATGSLYIQAYPTAGSVNFKVCNNTSGSLTPAALTLNWRVVR
jgi:hypothetical protein